MVELFKQVRSMIYLSKRIIHFLRQQNYIQANFFSQALVKDTQRYFTSLSEEVHQVVYPYFLPVIQTISELMEDGDEIRMADIYQLEVLPLLYQVMDVLCGESGSLLDDYWEGMQEDFWRINQEAFRRRYPEICLKLLESKEYIPDEYRVSLTRNGYTLLEIATEDNGIVRIDSACDPLEEALDFVETFKEAEEYLVVGWGMGHHVRMLLEQPYCKKIIILENDIYQIAISCMYHDWQWLIEDERVTFAFCTDHDEYFRYWNQALDKLKICIWYPSVKAMKDRFVRGKLEEAKITLSSMENMEDELNHNFTRNIEKKDEEVSSLKKKFIGKTVIFIAAGPSLDENIEKIKQNGSSKYILICVGKIAAKLIQKGIRPDYIIIIDAQARTKWQITGIEECGVPLIYISTAAFNVVEGYKGKRYIAFQEGFDIAEQYAEERKYPLYQTGGSVATFALDMLIQFRCSRIICIGLDMGYPGEQTHASGVGNTLVDKSRLYKIEGIESKFVYTSRPLDMYRQWIEKRIRGIKNIEIINVSKGARIHGMKEMKLEEALYGK